MILEIKETHISNSLKEIDKTVSKAQKNKNHKLVSHIIEFSYDHMHGYKYELNLIFYPK